MTQKQSKSSGLQDWLTVIIGAAFFWGVPIYLLFFAPTYTYNSRSVGTPEEHLMPYIVDKTFNTLLIVVVVVVSVFFIIGLFQKKK